jgi:DNA gyrase subunit B
MRDAQGTVRSQHLRDDAEGRVAVPLRLPQPHSEGQTKGKLNSDIKGDVEQLVNEKLGEWADKHPTVARRIIGNALMRPARARPPARLANDAASRAMDHPADCQENWRARSDPGAQSCLLSRANRRRSGKNGLRSQIPAILPPG